MELIAMILGIAAVCFLILYLSFNLDESHKHLQVFLIITFFFMLVLIPQTLVEYKDHCSFVNNETLVDQNTTTYVYDYQCETATEQIPSTFYKFTVWITRIFAVYVSIYLIWLVLSFFKRTVTKKDE